MAQHYVATRFEHLNGTVIRHVYGPFGNRYSAQKFVESQQNSLLPAQKERSEMSIHQPIGVGQDE